MIQNEYWSDVHRDKAIFALQETTLALNARSGLDPWRGRARSPGPDGDFPCRQGALPARKGSRRCSGSLAGFVPPRDANEAAEEDSGAWTLLKGGTRGIPSLGAISSGRGAGSQPVMRWLLGGGGRPLPRQQPAPFQPASLSRTADSRGPAPPRGPSARLCPTPRSELLRGSSRAPPHPSWAVSPLLIVFHRFIAFPASHSRVPAPLPGDDNTRSHWAAWQLQGRC